MAFPFGAASNQRVSQENSTGGGSGLGIGIGIGKREREGVVSELN